MSRKRKRYPFKGIMAVVLMGVMLGICLLGVHLYEKKIEVPIEHAGMQMTEHTTAAKTAQVFMNDRWYAQRNMDTLLVMGIDQFGGLSNTDSYNNDSQTDFLALFMRDLDTGRTAVVHVNRDTMTDITTLGVTGQPTGTRHAQLALAYNYGSDTHISSSNVVSAVEHLLYGVEIDHYLTLTMDAVPILNDWADGVVLEVLDDFSGVDNTLVQGEMVRLQAQQALTYVRARSGLEDSTNIHRMERQRQYAAEWMRSAQDKLSDKQAVAALALQLDGTYRSDCTLEQLAVYAENLSGTPSIPAYEIQGSAIAGDAFMEYHVDEEALQQLVLDLFYAPVE